MLRIFSKKKFTLSQAKSLGTELGIDWHTSKFTPAQLLRGMHVELEHTDVTKGDPKLTCQIALAHLNEMGTYYERLAEMEKK